MKVLVTSTSFQDNPGRHQDELAKLNLDLDYLKGPLKEEVLLPVIEKYDAVLMGDDEYTRKVIELGSRSKLKVLSKYGVGLDKVDLQACEEYGVKVANVKGLNQNSVAEHVLALLFAGSRRLFSEFLGTREDKWLRTTGREINGSTLGIVGHGNIGKEVLNKAHALGLKTIVFDIDTETTIEEVFEKSDFITLHCPLNSQTTGMVNTKLLSKAKEDLILINTARGGIVNQLELASFLSSHPKAQYYADVLENEPLDNTCKINKLNNVFITSHIASRTVQNVEKQGLAAVRNLAIHLGLSS